MNQCMFIVYTHKAINDKLGSVPTISAAVAYLEYRWMLLSIGPSCICMQMVNARHVPRELESTLAVELLIKALL